MSLTESETRIIDITEKVCSILSVLGEAFVIVTFLLGSKFRKPINRLVFYATWGNIFTNIATLIGTSGISLGTRSPLCQFQAFIIQWLMPADALWTFAMACNVWLSFFHHHDASRIRSLEWKYFLLCYGIPFLPAFSFFFVKTDTMGSVYGDAVLWCWISIDWDFLRVAVFYAPVWIVILLTIGIYVRVGSVIWRWRQQLNSLGRHSERETCRGNAQRDTPVHGIRRTDEFTVTREMTNESRNCQYSQESSRDASADGFEKGLSTRLRDRLFSARKHSCSRGSKGTFRAASRQANKATVKYCKCAMLFFVALLITWVPSTINRIYTLVYPEAISFGMQFAAAVVLPLQGFWNCVVYITTSIFACKCLRQDILAYFHSRRSSFTESVRMTQRKQSTNLGHSREGRPDSDTASLRPGQDC